MKADKRTKIIVKKIIKKNKIKLIIIIIIKNEFSNYFLNYIY